MFNSMEFKAGAVCMVAFVVGVLIAFSGCRQIPPKKIGPCCPSPGYQQERDPNDVPRTKLEMEKKEASEFR